MKQYQELKKEDPNLIYIFQVGIFYNILNEDARIVSNEIGLKLTDLSPEIIKCGFPISKLDKYTQLLDSHNLKYKLVSTHTSSNQNTSYDDIIKKIENIGILCAPSDASALRSHLSVVTPTTARTAVLTST